jgi:hypothetical protein
MDLRTHLSTKEQSVVDKTKQRDQQRRPAVQYKTNDINNQAGNME